MIFENQLQEIKKNGLFRELRSVQGKKILNFCSNDYLGLSQDPRVIQGAVEATREYGAGSGAARLISGNNALLEALEEKLFVWKGVEACLLFNSGYHANIGIIPVLAGEGDLIFSDELNHASLIDGCRLSKARTVIYRHNDVGHLEELLRRGGTGRILIVTESVFSMEGDLSPVEELKQLAEKYGVLLYIDEAHAVGVFGENGEGRIGKNPPEYLISMGTLGKAFGSYGAFVSGTKVLKEYLINKARPFIFSTNLPPAAIGASLASLKIVQTEPERRKKLWENICFVRDHLCPERGQSPIFSIRIGDAQKTMEVSERLLKEGIYIQGIRPPTVPEGTSRLRLTVSASHTSEQLEKLKSLKKLYAKNCM